MAEKNVSITAKTARKLAEEAKSRIKVWEIEEAVKKAAETKALAERMKVHAKSSFEDKCMAAIQEAARDGKNSTTVFVSNPYARKITEADSYLAQYTSELLEGAGFAANVQESRDEPHGSDPIVDYTVYSLFINISW